MVRHLTSAARCCNTTLAGRAFASWGHPVVVKLSVSVFGVELHSGGRGSQVGVQQHSRGRAQKLGFGSTVGGGPQVEVHRHTRWPGGSGQLLLWCAGGRGSAAMIERLTFWLGHSLLVSEIQGWHNHALQAVPWKRAAFWQSKHLLAC